VTTDQPVLEQRQAARADETGHVELTILMPCLNEAETVGTCVAKALDFLQRSGVKGEVLVADNGSSDGSQDIVKKLGGHVVNVSRRGYGAALQGGIAAARGRYTIMGDADDSYDFLHLDKFVAKLREGNDLVMGNRFAGGIFPGAMPPLHRYFGNPLLSFLGRLFYKIPVGDFYCGLRGFNTASLRRLGLVAEGMEFAYEMIIRSSFAGYRIAEVPTTLSPDGRSRPPHLRTWRDGWRTLKFLLMYSPRWLFLIPGSLLIAIGLVLVGLLISGPLYSGDKAVLDLNTFIAGCFMIIAGVQILNFGVLVRYYAAVTGFLPDGTLSNMVRRYVTTDYVIRVAAGLLVAGMAVSGFVLKQWASVGFEFAQPINPMVPRLLITGLSLIVIAIQLGFQAFMFGILDIPLKKRER
jgi:glycosyltransferase involved in cell wall biosynthesis